MLVLFAFCWLLFPVRSIYRLIIPDAYVAQIEIAHLEPGALVQIPPAKIDKVQVWIWLPAEQRWILLKRGYRKIRDNQIVRDRPGEYYATPIGLIPTYSILPLWNQAGAKLRVRY